MYIVWDITPENCARQLQLSMEKREKLSRLASLQKLKKRRTKAVSDEELEGDEVIDNEHEIESEAESEFDGEEVKNSLVLLEFNLVPFF